MRVQSLAESGINSIPKRYIKPPSQRPSSPSSTHKKMVIINPSSQNGHHHEDDDDHHQHQDDINIPVIDLQELFSPEEGRRKAALALLSEACRDWGFFQVVNHGVSHKLMKQARETWRDFFGLPLEVKQEYSNSPTTYEGYGSRLGVEKGAILDWSDYFFLHFMPPELRNPEKWPSLPPSCR